MELSRPQACWLPHLCWQLLCLKLACWLQLLVVCVCHTLKLIQGNGLAQLPGGNRDLGEGLQHNTPT